MSALPPKADIGTQSRNVCFVPKADIALRRVATKQTVTPIGHPALRAGGGAVYIIIAIVAQVRG